MSDRRFEIKECTCNGCPLRGPLVAAFSPSKTFDSGQVDALQCSGT